MLRRLAVKCFLACALLNLAFPVAVQSTQVPKQSDICVDGVVDKKKLVTFLLDAYGVGRVFEQSLPPDPVYAHLASWERLFVDEDLQPPCEKCSAEFKKKHKKDIDALGAATAGLFAMLTLYPEAYENVTGTSEPGNYLKDQQARLVCRRVNEKPVEAPGAPEPAGFNYVLQQLRIRGSTDGLYLTREAGSFKSLPQASISFVGDGLKSTRTNKLNAVAAYSFEFEKSSDEAFPSYSAYQLIPYVAANLNVVRTNGKPKKTNTKTVAPGILGVYFSSLEIPQGPILGNVIMARPEYLFDYANDTRLFSMNFSYTPTINNVLNDYRRVVANRDDLLSFRPMFDVKFAEGIYARKGTSRRERHSNFTRLGTQVGVAFSSDNKDLPFDLTLTNTYLGGLAGYFHKLNYFRAVLGYRFDPNNYFSINLSYNNGRREDTAQRERLWSTSLSARY